MMIIRIQLLAENQFKYSTFPSINIPSFQNVFYSYFSEISIIKAKQNFVRSGIRTHASNWRPEHSYADAAQVRLESGALDRSAILT